MSELFPQLPILLQALEDIQAIDVVTLNVSQQTSITDYMVICSGRSSRHVKAVADAVIVKLKSIGLPPLHVSGLESGDWALVDFGDCILHIMQPDSRSFYCLEALWS